MDKCEEQGLDIRVIDSSFSPSLRRLYTTDVKFKFAVTQSHDGQSRQDYPFDSENRRDSKLEGPGAAVQTQLGERYGSSN